MQQSAKPKADEAQGKADSPPSGAALQALLKRLKRKQAKPAQRKNAFDDDEDLLLRASIARQRYRAAAETDDRADDPQQARCADAIDAGAVAADDTSNAEEKPYA